MLRRKDKRRPSTNSTRRRTIKSTKSLLQTASTNPYYDQLLLSESLQYSKTVDVKIEHSSVSQCFQTQNAEVRNNEYEAEEVYDESTKELFTPFDEVRQYLKQNSLASKRLTIFHLLRPVSTTVKESEKLELINRYALAKVWDDLVQLPYDSHAKKLELVDHYAYNLEQYEIKLERSIKEYNQFLSEFIWKWLAIEHKERLGPRINWLNLSQDERNRYTQEIIQEQHHNQDTLELIAWKKLTEQQKQQFLARPVVYNETTKDLLKSILHSAGSKPVLQGVTKMETEIKHAGKLLEISKRIRRYKGTAKGEEHEKPQLKHYEKRQSPRINLNIGERVLCRYDGDGHFYMGTLQESEDGHSIVFFDMDIEQRTNAHSLVIIDHLRTQLALFLQDYVLVRRRTETEEYWVPGVIVGVAPKICAPPDLYKVEIYNPDPNRIFIIRDDLIRITQELFQRSVFYLRKIYHKFGVAKDIDHDDEPDDTKTPSATISDIDAIVRKYVGSLTSRIETVHDSFLSRYEILRQTLVDQMAAINIVSKRPPSFSGHDESIQTIAEKTERPATGGDELKPGTRVYTIWCDDDALFYAGTIVQLCTPKTYLVERIDLFGVRSVMSREDIFLDSDFRILGNVPINTFILIKYPQDSRQMYCPALILGQDPETSTTRVRFYCCESKDVGSDQHVILLNHERFERYSKLRIAKEVSLVGQIVVGLNQEKNVFMLGTIKERVKCGHYFSIKWCDDTTSIQSDEHLFGAFTRRNEHRVNDYVLAIDESDKIYKLAIIKSISDDRKNLRIEYIHVTDPESSSLKRQADVLSLTTFILTKVYYNKLIDRKHGASG